MHVCVYIRQMLAEMDVCMGGRAAKVIPLMQIDMYVCICIYAYLYLYTYSHCSTLQHAAIHCNTLQVHCLKSHLYGNFIIWLYRIETFSKLICISHVVEWIERCVAVCYSLLQRTAVCCSMILIVSRVTELIERRSLLQSIAVCCSLLQSVAVCCSLLQSLAVYCSLLQSIAVCCSVFLIISHVPEWIERRANSWNLTVEIWESQPFIEILKSELYSNFIEVIELRADFWEFVSGWKCAREWHVVAGWRMVAGKQVQILCVAACCSVLQRVAFAACFSVLQLQCLKTACCLWQVLGCWEAGTNSVCCSVLQCVAACCSVLQHLQHIAVCCSCSVWKGHVIPDKGLFAGKHVNIRISFKLLYTNTIELTCKFFWLLSWLLRCIFFSPAPTDATQRALQPSRR